MLYKGTFHCTKDSAILLQVNTSPGNEGIIYSISWAPADLNCIVAGTSKTGLFIWDIKRGRVTKRFQEVGIDEREIVLTLYKMTKGKRLQFWSATAF